MPNKYKVFQFPSDEEIDREIKELFNTNEELKIAIKNLSRM